MAKRNYTELIDKYLSGTLSDPEAAELLQWLENDSQLNNWWVAELSKENNKMNLNQQEDVLRKVKNIIEQDENAPVIPSQDRKKSSAFYLNALKWVAVICLPILLFTTYYVYQGQSEPYETPLTVKVEREDRASLVLPDGTNVNLNSVSQLSYLSNYGKKERRVKLSGEAFFNVTPDTEHPFIVQTGSLEVKVLGTSFNISSYEDQEDITIVLLNGKVGVFADNKSYSMNPNDKIVYNKSTGKISSSKVYPQDYIEWTKGNLYFDNESLENISKVLERVYNMNIRIESENLKKERFSGTIGSGGIRNALDKLMMASSFTYELEDSVIVLKNLK